MSYEEDPMRQINDALQRNASIQGRVDKLLTHAAREFQRLGTDSQDEGRVAVERLLTTLGTAKGVDTEGARSWILHVLSQLAVYKPLTPLVGNAHEFWPIPANMRGSCSHHNIRLSSVLANVHPDGSVTDAIDVSGITVILNNDPSTAWSTWTPISFPYMPQNRVLHITTDRSKPDDEVQDDIDMAVHEARQTVMQVNITRVERDG